VFQGLSFMEVFYDLSAIGTAIGGVLIGVFVYLKNPRSPVNRSFAMFLASIVLWSLPLFLCQVVKDKETALFWNRILHVGASLIPVTFLRYALIYLKQYERKRKLFWFVAIYQFIIIALDLFTPLLIKDMVPKWYFHLWPEPGILYPFFLLMFSFTFNYIFFILYMEYRKSSGHERIQLRYILVAIMLAVTGGSSNYFLFYNIRVQPLGNWFCTLYCVIIAYAIVRYKLFEIDTVIHRTILWLLTSSSILIPMGALIYFSRAWLTGLNWLQLTFVLTALFYVYLFYYRKTQPVIDHVFRRKKYDYYRVLSEVGQKIGSELDINRVVGRLFQELKDVLYIRNGLVLVQQPGQFDYTEAGSIGYDSLQGGQKPEKIVLLSNGALSRYFSIHQRAIEREQVEIDPQYTPIKEEAGDFLAKNAIEVLIPVVMENKVNAFIGIGKKENLQNYTIKDIELLENMGRQIGITIDNAMHHEDIVEKERLAEEMKLGREIQMALLPQEIPLIRGLIVQGLMQPAKEIGGDYYDFITLPDKDQLAIAIGDVSGKGVAAGLLMAMAKTAIHTLSQEENSPRQVLMRTNNILNKHIGAQKFMTLLYLTWQAKTNILTYSSGGHEHILVYKSKTGTVESIVSGGFMLGMLPDIDRFLEEKQLHLDPHDKILLYTDGVTEAENQAKDRYGLEKLQEAFVKYGSKPADELMRLIKEEVYSFIGNHPQYDDITLVVLEAQ